MVRITFSNLPVVQAFKSIQQDNVKSWIVPFYGLFIIDPDAFPPFFRNILPPRPVEPSPILPVTIIEYDIPVNAAVQLLIYDILGRQVRVLVNESMEAGYKSVRWNGTNDQGQNVSAGMYFYSIQAGDFAQTSKMILLK